MVSLGVGLTGGLLPIIAAVGTAGLNCVRGNTCKILKALLISVPPGIFFFIWGAARGTLTLYLGFSAVASLFVAAYVDAEATSGEKTA